MLYTESRGTDSELKARPEIQNPFPSKSLKLIRAETNKYMYLSEETQGNIQIVKVVVKSPYAGLSEVVKTFWSKKGLARKRAEKWIELINA